MFGLPPVSFTGPKGENAFLLPGKISCDDQIHSLVGVHADVGGGTAVESRITATRLAAFGVFALAIPKKTGGEQFLTIEGPDFAWSTKVSRDQVVKAKEFATAVNNSARKAESRKERKN